MDSSTNKYSINLIWSDKDNGYIATCPEFLGLSAFGATPEAALSEAKIALGLLIETYQEDGLVLPVPQLVQPYSGQFRLRLPKSLHAQIARLAEAEGVSQNQFILAALGESVGEKQQHAQIGRAHV